MQCPHCHADGQDGRFCKKCGKPLDQDVSDMTRVMPPLEALHEKPTETAPDDEAQAAADALTEALDEAEAGEEQTATAPDAVAANTDTTDEGSPENDEASDEESPEDSEAHDEEAAETDDAGEEFSEDAEESSEENEAANKPQLPAFLLEEDGDSDDLSEDPMQERRKKLLTATALIIGILLAAIAAVYLFTDFFDTTPQTDPAEQVKNADTIAPDTSLAEDTIVGHWRHYNEGSVIEKIGTAQYRWTIGDKVYPLDFADNKYTYEDENGNTYIFVLTDADHIQLAASSDKSGGLITNPAFESNYIAGRVGQDGTMAESMSVNGDAFNIVGKTYAELAGTYGPGSLSVIGDDQYIVFRGEGGNFAVQFQGETVPLSAQAQKDYDLTPLLSGSQSYSVVPMSYDNTTPVVDSTPNGTTDPSTGGDTTTGDGTTSTPPTVTVPPTTTTPTTPGNDSTTTTTTTTDDDEDEDTEYTVEIPDMPTFPSTTAVATGVVWADLGFVIKNAPSTLSVEDLSAVLGIALEVGTAPANESGFAFYGMDEGYFAGTYAYGDHSFYISGYGNSALAPDKTILFIQQIS